MRITDTLEPKSVFSYFADLCAIPHGSGNTKAISDYCVRFAESHGFEVHQDALNNVIIVCPATPGCESAEPVIIQGHLDMVTEKTADCPLDMTRDGLDLALDGDYLYARGTTLGGDDGIAIAMALAAMDDKTLRHPRIEAVFTVDEEVGMEGAAGLDVSPLTARRLLNIDSEDEGIFTVSCAGGARANVRLPLASEVCSLPTVVLELTGLTGGHSGTEIDKGRANAAILLGRALAAIGKIVPLRIVSAESGLKDNAIPASACAVLAVEPAKLPAVQTRVSELEAAFRAEHAVSDPGLTLTVRSGNPAPSALTEARGRQYGCAVLAARSERDRVHEHGHSRSRPDVEQSRHLPCRGRPVGCARICPQLRGLGEGDAAGAVRDALRAARRVDGDHWQLSRVGV